MEARTVSDPRWARQRERLVERVRERGVQDLQVLHAVSEVPRHLFVPEGVRHRAYEDAALPIGWGQTISQPSIQALYMDRLGIAPGQRVLEIGTGSGYQTALLARVADHVYSVERIRELSVRARGVLEGLGLRNVALLVGDGTVGWSRFAPYDAILVAAGAPRVPEALVEQLAPGGRMLVPVGTREEQRLVRVTRTGDGWEEETMTACVFVPLLGRFGWAEAGRTGEGA